MQSRIIEVDAYTLVYPAHVSALTTTTRLVRIRFSRKSVSDRVKLNEPVRAPT